MNIHPKDAVTGHKKDKKVALREIPSSYRKKIVMRTEKFKVRIKESLDSPSKNMHDLAS